MLRKIGELELPGLLVDASRHRVVLVVEGAQKLEDAGEPLFHETVMTRLGEHAAP